MAEVLAVGFFDGVHRGHRKILEGATAALTFRNHPSEILSPDAEVPLLMPFEEKVAAIKECGVGKVTALDFTKELANISAGDFLAMLGDVKTIRSGANWRFGKGGEGDGEFLRRMGYEVEVVDYAEYGGAAVSSTRIREAISQGEIPDANAMLGRVWTLEGRIESGKGLGAKMGCPTVNIRLSEFSRLLRSGVYEVSVAGERGIANFGFAPTMGSNSWKDRVLEVHFDREVPDFSSGGGRVGFVRFLRPEIKFDSIEALKAQIAADCRAVFGER